MENNALNCTGTGEAWLFLPSPFCTLSIFATKYAWNSIKLTVSTARHTSFPNHCHCTGLHLSAYYYSTKSKSPLCISHCPCLQPAPRARLLTSLHISHFSTCAHYHYVYLQALKHISMPFRPHILQQQHTRLTLSSSEPSSTNSTTYGLVLL